MVRDRDVEFDKDLDEIGEGIQDLQELALRQGEEVRRQNAMLEQTTARIDKAHEHMTNVNSKMKDTLNEVGRSSDKLCVDIWCIVSLPPPPPDFFNLYIFIYVFGTHCCKSLFVDIISPPSSFFSRREKLLMVGFAGIIYKMMKGQF